VETTTLKKTTWSSTVEDVVSTRRTVENVCWKEVIVVVVVVPGYFLIFYYIFSARGNSQGTCDSPNVGTGMKKRLLPRVPLFLCNGTRVASFLKRNKYCISNPSFFFLFWRLHTARSRSNNGCNQENQKRLHGVIKME
jgi:hypothetical protein